MTTFYVKVRPEAGSFQIDISGTHPTIALTTPAEQGRANAELLERLTDILGVAVGIRSGHRSRRKELVADLPEQEIREKLAASS